jgi:hypothetical protein
MSKEMSIEEEIKGLLNPKEEANEEIEEIVEEQSAETVGQSDKPVDENPAETQEVQKEVKFAKHDEAPAALTGAMKAKWKELPEDVRQEWSKRELDFQRAMTGHEGDLRIGREMKEIITPYLATIQAEGGTPAGAVKDLLNTAYILRTGNPVQKSQLLHQVAQQYGIDLNLGRNDQGNQVDPHIQQLYARIDQLSQQANPEVIKSQLQEQMTRDTITAEVSDFASNPKNVHFETVRSAMGPLMMSGQAKNLQEAYDMACWANPSIRSTMLSAQEAEKQAKQRQEIEAKRKAAASVTGSPGLTSPTDRTPQKSLEDDIRDQLREASGVII